MKMNIVIVTKNRPRMLEQTIRTLYQNTHLPAPAINLTVVDDCSDSRALVTALSNKYRFHLILNEQPTPLGGSRNKVLEKLDDGMVYISDDDVYFTPYWLHKLLVAWGVKPADIKILGGGCHRYLGTNRSTVSRGIEYHYKDALSGWSWLMDLETWKRYGPYDANALGVGQSEDWAFCQRVKQDGFEVASVFPEVVIHCGKTNAEGKPATGSETIFSTLPGVLVE